MSPERVAEVSQAAGSVPLLQGNSDSPRALSGLMIDLASAAGSRTAPQQERGHTRGRGGGGEGRGEDASRLQHRLSAAPPTPPHAHSLASPKAPSSRGWSVSPRSPTPVAVGSPSLAGVCSSACKHVCVWCVSFCVVVYMCRCAGTWGCVRMALPHLHNLHTPYTHPTRTLHPQLTRTLHAQLTRILDALHHLICIVGRYVTSHLPSHLHQ